MNFLAHLFLSYSDENLIVGNFIADFIRNNETKNYSKEVQKGIVLHRKIDSFTDSHPKVKTGTRRLQPFHRKYSPVIIDIYYDYLLAKNWHLYSSEPLNVFTAYIYSVLNKRMEDMPDRLIKRLPSMIEADWLRSYSTVDGLQFAFERLKKRSSFPNKFEIAVNHLMKDMDLFNKEFNLFFPDLIAYVHEVQYRNISPQSEEK